MINSNRGSVMWVQNMRRFMILLTVTLLLNSIVLAQVFEPISPKLTPRLQELLREEMRSIDEASQGIFAALVAGNDAQVAALAGQIRDSFILRQAMTPEDKKHLVTVAPEGFVPMDQAFHQIAGALAQAARAGDRTAQHQQFGRMVAACSGCHARYAADRFTGFSR